MVFSGLYPTNSEDFEDLRASLEKLQLNDASLSYEPESAQIIQLESGIEDGTFSLYCLNGNHTGYLYAPLGSSAQGSKISLADLIVLGGAAAIEQAARAGGVAIEVPFTPGRTDASQAQTDVASFALLEPTADAFRNYFDVEQSYRSPTEMLVDKADLLDLSVPEVVQLSLAAQVNEVTQS